MTHIRIPGRWQSYCGVEAPASSVSAQMVREIQQGTKLLASCVVPCPACTAALGAEEWVEKRPGTPP